MYQPHFPRLWGVTLWTRVELKCVITAAQRMRCCRSNARDDPRLRSTCTNTCLSTEGQSDTDYDVVCLHAYILVFIYLHLILHTDSFAASALTWPFVTLSRSARFRSSMNCVNLTYFHPASAMMLGLMNPHFLCSRLHSLAYSQLASSFCGARPVVTKLMPLHRYHWSHSFFLILRLCFGV
ncbi:unnamed protein product [Protopolystoma xenopodis]|uniref:Uncharacterized protein n=1 Tax=Protopolystoma xenopodis TaxID=117903 RepID=A0A3S5FDR6_9PLAT|nr:unnamed protein product [Protopolystoma xenopodis]